MTNASDFNIPAKLSGAANAIIADLLMSYAAETRITLTRADCISRGGWSLSTQLNKEKAGYLLSILDGVSRRITARSFYQHLIDLAISSHPLNAPAARARSRQTKTSFRRPFVPSAAQLEGLRRGNAQRAAAAEARRNARDAQQLRGP
jgi:hypothetical protein